MQLRLSAANLEALWFRLDTEGYATAITTEAIPAQTRILSCSHALAITYAKAAAALPPHLSAPNSQVDRYAILVAFLVFEKLKGNKSFWHPYISTLPPVSVGCGGPLFEDPRDVELWLNGTNLKLEKVEKIKQDWRNDWNCIRDSLRFVKGWEDRAEQLTW